MCGNAKWKSMLLLLTTVLVVSIVGCASFQLADLEGSWDVDQVQTSSWYIEQGIPWHMDVNAVRSGKFLRYQLVLDRHNYSIRLGTQVKSTGHYEVIYADGKDFVLELDHGSEAIRQSKSREDLLLNQEQLRRKGLQMVAMQGEQVRNWLGIRLLDSNKAMQFSMVRGKDQAMERKSDGIILNRRHQDEE